ncbi:MAG: hypothetical protein LBI71_04605 [Enterobacteriaceae bacterium]|jgi:hypothetical protein|nr:hypothetical protein [Enterobacteriaceae bacterium]
MKLFKKYLVYSVSLSTMFIVNGAFASAYYEVGFGNKSNDAIVTFQNVGTFCMYDGGSSDPIILSPHKSTIFKIEDDDNVFDGCLNRDKVETWNVQYTKPNAATEFCQIKFTHDRPDFTGPWVTYFATVGNCSIPLTLACNGYESACNGEEDIISVVAYTNK